MATIYLSLGTNLGHREQNLRRGIAGLRQIAKIKQLSAVYETPPWGPIQDQPAFYNMCLSAECELSPHDLLRELKALELRIGRRDSQRWGPRLIDIDLLFYDDLILKSDLLNIPHKQAAQRAFVLVPLADFAPDLQHPELGLTVSEQLADVDTAGVEKLEQVDLDRPRLFEWGARTYIMGIVNATPDSFSGDGLIKTPDQFVEQAVEQARQMVLDGADIIDVGGESTRPGAQKVTAEQEIARVIPVIEGIRDNLPNVVVSIDSYRPEVAKAAVAAGADWINDIWGLQYQNGEMAAIVAEAACPIIIMHNGRNRPRLSKDDGAGGYYGYFEYEDLMGEMCSELQAAAEQAMAAGIAADNIILDPGIGFGKTAPQNLVVLDRLNEIKALGFPLLLGSSRKGFIGRYLGDLPSEERVEGTGATISIGIDRGADIVRVHDVKPMSRVARMTDMIVRT